jgi:hypothetical protein
MAFPTSVNDQVTDAVTQSNVKVLAEGPAMAMGALYQSLAHATGILYENSTSNQMQSAILAQAVTTTCVAKLYSLDGQSVTIGEAKPNA